MIKTIQDIREELALTAPSVAQIADYLNDCGEHDSLNSTYILTDPTIDGKSFHGGEDYDDEFDAHWDELDYHERVWTN